MTTSTLHTEYSDTAGEGYAYATIICPWCGKRLFQTAAMITRMSCPKCNREMQIRMTDRELIIHFD